MLLLDAAFRSHADNCADSNAACQYFPELVEPGWIAIATHASSVTITPDIYFPYDRSNDGGDKPLFGRRSVSSASPHIFSQRELVSWDVSARRLRAHRRRVSANFPVPMGKKGCHKYRLKLSRVNSRNCFNITTHKGVRQPQTCPHLTTGMGDECAFLLPRFFALAIARRARIPGRRKRATRDDNAK